MLVSFYDKNWQKEGKSKRNLFHAVQQKLFDVDIFSFIISFHTVQGIVSAVIFCFNTFFLSCSCLEVKYICEIAWNSTITIIIKRVFDECHVSDIFFLLHELLLRFRWNRKVVQQFNQFFVPSCMLAFNRTRTHEPNKKNWGKIAILGNYFDQIILELASGASNFQMNINPYQRISSWYSILSQ